MLETLTRNKLFFALSVLFGILAVLFIIALLLPSGTKQPPTSAPEKAISPLEQVIIDKTTQQEVKNLDTVEQEETLPDGSTRYSLKSPLMTRKNEVVVKEGLVVFERILVPERRAATGYATISKFKEKFGEPEQTIRGSRYYGHPIATLIYAGEGFALVANTTTDEVYEIQRFQPMTVTSYRNLYGEDIDENAEPQL